MYLALFTTKYYLPYIPKEGIMNFKVPAWKCITLNAGAVAEKPIMFKRLTDDKAMHVSFYDLGRSLWSEPEYIKWVTKMGYQVKIEDTQLVFTPSNSSS